jgi:coproporphyrinogen III oxidase-like Fe-S oxidoreductase
LIDKLITKTAKSEFSRVLQFDERENPILPRDNENNARLLYLHVPFCESLCPYCSFNRVLFKETLCREYFKALRKEITLYRDRGYSFNAIYVGGGTPTVLIDELEETLLLARGYFRIREISVETNPNHLTERNITILKRVGTTRLSVGIQSFDDDLLKAIGRYDSYGSGKIISERLTNTLGRFDTLNADMIFNFPIQTIDSISKDLDILIRTGVDQITYYPLMVSDFTRRTMDKTMGQVDYGKEKRFYRLISRHLSPDYRFTSAWCFSKKAALASLADEYIVDYNEYAGLGSGSIGYINGRCYANTFDIRQYIDIIDREEVPLMASRDFSLSNQIRYDFLMKLFGLRLEIVPLHKKYGRNILPYLWREISAFMMAGGLRYHHGCFYLTDRGRYYWIIMMREFFTAVDNFRDFCMRR